MPDGSATRSSARLGTNPTSKSCSSMLGTSGQRDAIWSRTCAMAGAFSRRPAPRSAVIAPDAADLFLPPAVLPDFRKRCLVGARLHGLAERRAGSPQVPWSPSTARSGGSRLLRPPAGGDAGGSGRVGGPVRDRWFLLLPLLVQRPTASGASLQRRAGLGPTGSSVLPVLGQRELDAAVGWP